MLNRTDVIIVLIVGSITKYIVLLSEYFPKPKSLGANVKVKSDLSNYVTKADLKNATGVNTSDFIKKTDVANLKSDLDNLNIDKIESNPVHLSKLRNLVKNYVITNFEHNKLVKNLMLLR